MQQVTTEVPSVIFFRWNSDLATVVAVLWRRSSPWLKRDLEFWAEGFLSPYFYALYFFKLPYNSSGFSFSVLQI